MNSWLTWQTEIANQASATIEFATNWFVQAMLLTTIGLVLGVALRRKGSAVQSLVYRTTLIAVLISPLATCVLNRAGVSGWSIRMPSSTVVQESTPVAGNLKTASSHAIADALVQPAFDPSGLAPQLDAVDSGEFGVGPAIGATPTTISDAQFSEQGAVAPVPMPLLPTQPVIEPEVASGYQVTWFGYFSVAVVITWAIVSGWLLLRLGMAWRRLSRLVGCAKSAEDATCQLCAELADKLNVASPRVLRSPFVVSPCLTGLGIVHRPAILLPEEPLELPMHNVLVHELSHLRRRDCHWNLLRQVATSIFFFQPLLWRLSRRIEETAEEVCDDFVVGNGGDREEYASRLVDLAELSTAFAPAAVATAGVGIVSLRSMLARRVERITDTSRTLSTRVGSFVLLGIILGGLAITSLAGLVGLSSPTHAAVSTLGEEHPSEEKEKNPKPKQGIPTLKAADVVPPIKSTATYPKPAADAKEIVWNGLVRDAQGKPVSDALVYHAIITDGPEDPQKWREPVKTDSQGHFQIKRRTSEIAAYALPWRASAFAVKEGQGYGHSLLVPTSRSELRLREDHPLSGRILDINGQPVAGARLKTIEVKSVANNDFDKWRELAAKPDTDYYQLRELERFVRKGQPLDRVVPPVVTDSDGHFTIMGIGKGRIARLLLEGPDIESTRLYVRTEKGETVKVPMQSNMSRLPPARYFPSEFEFVAGPSVPITGFVKASDTGKALSGIEVISQKRAGRNLMGWGEDFVRTKTDEKGRFRLEGMPIGKDNVIAAILGYGANPDGDLVPYLSTARRVATDGQLQQVEADLTVQRGVWVAGRITDRDSGEGKRATVEYFCASSNPMSTKRRNGVDERETMRTDKDGNFRVAVLPGEGYLAIMVHDHERYQRAAVIRLQDGSEEPASSILDTRPHALMPSNYHVVSKLDIGDTKDHEVRLDIELGAGVDRMVKVVGPNGRSISDACHYTGRTASFSDWRTTADGTLELKGCNSDVRRRVFVRCPDQGLAGHLDIKGDPGANVSIKLKREGTVSGRVVNSDGEPLPNRNLVRWSASIEIPSMVESVGSFHLQPPLPYNPANQRGQNKTDDQGRFQLSGLVPGVNYRVSVLPGKDDKYMRSLDVVIRCEAGETKDLGDIKLVRLDDTQEFQDEALKQLSKQAATAKPNLRKAALLASIPSEKTKPGMVSKAMSSKAAPPLQVVRATVGVTKSKESNPLSPTGQLEVQAALPNGQPAKNADVALVLLNRRRTYPQTAFQGKTDDEGRCQVSWKDLESDDLEARVLVKKQGYGIAWSHVPGVTGPLIVGIGLKKEQPIKLKLVDVDGQPAVNEELRIAVVMNTAKGVWGSLDRKDVIGVGVRRAQNGTAEPINAWISNVKTNADGRVTLNNIPEGYGVYCELVNSTKFAPQSIALNTGQSEQRGERDATYRPLIKNISPGEEGVLTLAPAQVITGKITYEDTGEPVPNTKVAIWASQQAFGSMSTVEGKTDENGNYRILPEPGIRFGVSAYAPTGKPYMARKADPIRWENGDETRQVNIALPRAVLVIGRVVETDSGNPVAKAKVTYESGKGAEVPENAISGWQASQETDAEGRFAYAVPPGNGVLQVKHPNGKYVLQTFNARNGGQRRYAHAFHKIEPTADTKEITAEIRLQPGHGVRGRVVDEKGDPVNEFQLITNLKVWDLSGHWRADGRPNLHGKFELNNLEKDKEYSVSFLDPRRKLGATVKLKASEEPVTVVLKPCGSAKVRFLVEDKERRYDPDLMFIATPGSSKYDYKSMEGDKMSADSDHNANVDRVNYAIPRGPKPDKDGNIEFPALIPGATYRLRTSFDGFDKYKDFQVKSGETLDLGEFTPKFRD